MLARRVGEVEVVGLVVHHFSSYVDCTEKAYQASKKR